jgi:putative peptidoglycan lipid II flippase
MQVLIEAWGSSKKFILRHSQIQSFFLGFGFTQVLLILRDVLTARTYGLSKEFDSWTLIIGGATFVVAALAGGLSGFLVPKLQKFLLLKEWPKESLVNFKKNILKVFFLVLVMLAILQAVVLFYKFDQPPIIYILSGLVVAFLSFQIVFRRAQLQAKMNVIGVSGTPSISILISICIILSCSKFLGIYALILGFIIGLGIELYTIQHLLEKTNQHLTAVKSPLVINETDYWTYWQLAGAGALQGASVILDQLMIASMFGGGVAALAYGGKATAAVIGILGGFLQVVLFPVVARNFAARGSFAGIKKKVLLVGLISITAAAFLYMIANPLVELLFLGGKFSESDSHIVASLHKIFVLQLPFYLVGAIGVQMLQVLGRGKSMLLIGALGLLLKAVFNIVLGKKLGIYGFAWATVALYVWNFCLIWSLFLWKRKNT